MCCDDEPGFVHGSIGAMIYSYVLQPHTTGPATVSLSGRDWNC